MYIRVAPKPLGNSDHLFRWRGQFVVAPSKHTLLQPVTMLRTHGSSERTIYATERSLLSSTVPAGQPAHIFWSVLPFVVVSAQRSNMGGSRANLNSAGFQ